MSFPRNFIPSARSIFCKMMLFGIPEEVIIEFDENDETFIDVNKTYHDQLRNQ